MGDQREVRDVTHVVQGARVSETHGNRHLATSHRQESGKKGEYSAQEQYRVTHEKAEVGLSTPGK